MQLSKNLTANKNMIESVFLDQSFLYNSVHCELLQEVLKTLQTPKMEVARRYNLSKTVQTILSDSWY